jgi:cell division protein FtsW
MRAADFVSPRSNDADVGAIASSVGILALIGAVAVFSATATFSDATFSPHFVRHAAGIVLGGLLLFGSARLPLVAWYRLAYALYGVALAALVATLALGFVAGGARRWLMLPGGVVFQPVELAKLATVLAVCAYLSRNEVRGALTARSCVLALGFAAVPMALCLLQPDLGSAAVIAALVGLIVFVAGAPVRLLAIPALAGAAGVALYCALNPYAMRRVLAFRNPWDDPAGIGFQLVQSFVAFGRGGLFGTGPGNGLQKLHYLPEAHTDFILSVIAEEAGLIGVGFVLGLFVVLVLTGLRIAQRATHRFGLLLGFGATLLIGLPALLNGAVVMGLLPPKGLTLPFLSYGRSSLLVACIAAGILISIARASAPARRGSRAA